MKKDDELSPELFRVARGGETEKPFSGAYLDKKEKGMYKCAICSADLFSSDTKFDSDTGWPSFTDPVNLENIELRPDNSISPPRTEVLCKNCGAHLGHVFEDGPINMNLPLERQGKRYCINSVCLDFDPKLSDYK